MARTDGAIPHRMGCSSVRSLRASVRSHAAGKRLLTTGSAHSIPKAGADGAEAAELHGNVHSLAMIEAAARSATERRRGVLADILGFTS
jgi:hypothetical protein